MKNSCMLEAVPDISNDPAESSPVHSSVRGRLHHAMRRHLMGLYEDEAGQSRDTWSRTPTEGVTA
jgi:hypothetical protein